MVKIWAVMHAIIKCCEHAVLSDTLSVYSRRSKEYVTLVLRKFLSSHAHSTPERVAIYYVALTLLGAHEAFVLLRISASPPGSREDYQPTGCWRRRDGTGRMGWGGVRWGLSMQNYRRCGRRSISRRIEEVLGTARLEKE